MEEVRDPSGSLFIGFCQVDKASDIMTYKICQLRFNYSTGKFIMVSEGADSCTSSYMRCIKSISIHDPSIVQATLHRPCMNENSKGLEAHLVTMQMRKGSEHGSSFDDAISVSKFSVNDVIFSVELQRGTTCIDDMWGTKKGKLMNLPSSEFTSIIAGGKLYVLAHKDPFFKCYDPLDNSWTEVFTPESLQWWTENPDGAYGFVFVELYGEILISFPSGFYCYNVHLSRWIEVTLVDKSSSYSDAIAVFSGQGVCLPSSAHFFFFTPYKVLSYTLKPYSLDNDSSFELIFHGEYLITISDECRHRFEETYSPCWRGIVCLSEELLFLMEATYDADGGETQLYFDMVMLDINQRIILRLDSGQEKIMFSHYSSLTCFSLDCDVTCTMSKPLRTIAQQREKEREKSLLKPVLQYEERTAMRQYARPSVVFYSDEVGWKREVRHPEKLKEIMMRKQCVLFFWCAGKDSEALYYLDILKGEHVLGNNDELLHPTCEIKLGQRKTEPYGFVCTYLEQKLYMIPEYYDKYLSSPLPTFVLDMGKMKLELKRKMEATKTYSCVVAVSEKIYVLAHPSSTTPMTASCFECYDPKKDVWESLPDLPEGPNDRKMPLLFSGHAVVNEIFIIVSLVPCLGEGGFLHFYVYDTRKRVWHNVRKIDNDEDYCGFVGKAESVGGNIVVFWEGGLLVYYLDVRGKDFRLHAPVFLAHVLPQCVQWDPEWSACITHIGGYCFCVLATDPDYEKQCLYAIKFQLIAKNKGPKRSVFLRNWKCFVRNLCNDGIGSLSLEDCFVG